MRDFATAHIDKNFYADFGPREYWFLAFEHCNGRIGLSGPFSTWVGCFFAMKNQKDFLGRRPLYRIHVKLKEA